MDDVRWTMCLYFHLLCDELHYHSANKTSCQMGRPDRESILQNINFIRRLAYLTLPLRPRLWYQIEFLTLGKKFRIARTSSKR